MIRKFGFSILVMALIVSACGRQVTPNPHGVASNGIPAGFMQVKFRTAQPLDYANVTYDIVFNTSGVGKTPYPNCAQTNCQNYSFEFVVGGTGTSVSPVLLQYISQGTGNLAQVVQIVYIPGTDLIFNSNSNGQGNEFSITFNRGLFNGLLGTRMTPPPSPSASPIASASPSSSSSPTAAPTSTPQPSYSNVWYANFFTSQVDTSQPYHVGAPYDSLGVGGASDTSYISPAYNVDTEFDTIITATIGGNLPAVPAAQIAGGEVLNAP